MVPVRLYCENCFIGAELAFLPFVMAESFSLPQVALETELVHKSEGHLWLFEKTDPSALVESRRAARHTLFARLLFEVS